MLICIEGLTNSGKTTICKNLVAKMPLVYINDFMQKDVVATNLSKITTPISNLDKFNSKTELLLYLTILSQKAYWINKLNNNSTILLVDRFSLSVFSQFPACENSDKNFVRNLVSFATNGIVPDFTIFLDVSLDTILKRTEGSPFSRKDLSLPYEYEGIRNRYLENISQFCEEYQILDCGNYETSEDITNFIIGLINDFRKKHNQLTTPLNSKNNMVWISAGGKGSRLKNLTLKCPKPLLKIKNNHLLEYLCKYLISTGFSNRIFISYCYLQEAWDSFIATYKNHIRFSDSSGIPNLVADLLQCVKNTSYDNYIVISGDVIFDFSIIGDLIEKHCKNNNDISLALNRSIDNKWKFWDYVMDDEDNILDIVKSDVITHIERYCFIINRNVLEKYTSNFATNMGFDDKEFVNYKPYNSGWTYLVKRIIDYGGFAIKGYFYDKPVINVNTQDDLLRAKEYLSY